MILYNTRLNRGLPELIREQTLESPIQTITCPDHVFKICKEVFHLDCRTEEYLFAIAVNTKGDILGCFEVSHGTVNASLVSPREIFQKLFLVGAVSFFLAHNHPSMHPEPSEHDLKITRRIRAAGELIGIELLDHLIVCNSGYHRIEVS